MVPRSMLEFEALLLALAMMEMPNAQTKQTVSG